MKYPDYIRACVQILLVGKNALGVMHQVDAPTRHATLGPRQEGVMFPHFAHPPVVQFTYFMQNEFSQ